MICSLISSFFLGMASMAEPVQYLQIQHQEIQRLDTPLTIKVQNLKPLQIATIQAEAQNSTGDLWKSRATFQADALGIIDLSRDTPLEGSSYKDPDVTALFWSMLPVSKEVSSIFQPANDTFSVNISLCMEGQVVERKIITSYLKAPNVQRMEIREAGLIGTLFLPKGKKPHPIIVTLSGSNGGLSENRAKLLSSNGFAVLALAYFRADNLPPQLEEIPLEYFENTFSWIKQQPYLDSSHVGLYGVSRGAELALILGSLFPESIQAIVSVAPSSVVQGGSNSKNAWIYKGKAIAPFIEIPEDISIEGNSREHPAFVLGPFLKAMEDVKTFEKTQIPVEKITCPILLVSGGDDQIWPSQIYAEQVCARLKEKNSHTFAQHLHYPKAGHGINIPGLPIPDPVYFHPVANLWLSTGGSRSADAKASADSWNKMILFLQESLSKQ